MEFENNTNTKINNRDIDLCDELKRSIDALILYRSLYILKKKFESRKEIIKKIYDSFNLDSNENVEKYASYQVSIDNFDIIAKTVFEKCNILLIILNNPKDILLSNLFLNLTKKVDEMVSIFREMKAHILDEKKSLVQKYNSLFYDKKIKVKMIKDIIEIKQNKKEKKVELKKEEKEIITNEEKAQIKEIEEKQEEIVGEIEIQRKIVEYNRKGKIIRTYNITSNDNLTLLINNEKEKNEKIRQQRISQKERYFKFNEINESSKEKGFIKEEEEEVNSKQVNKEIQLENNLLDLENGRNYNTIIYIETLPLIIADYIQQFPFYCIIETEDELNEELNILFDKELVEKINNYEESLKNKNQKFINKEYQNYLIKMDKLENNIKIYENLIKEKKAKNENTSYLENMLDKLLINNMIVQNKLSELRTKNKNILNIENNELELDNKEIYIKNNNNVENYFDSSNISNISRLENKSASLPKFNDIKKNNIKLKEVRTKMIRKAKLDTNIKFDKSINLYNKTNRTDANAKIMASLKEIFTFYSKQHNSIGAKLLFSDLEKNMEQIGSSEFYKFCVEFNIPFTRKKANEIFKKALTLSTSTYHKLRLISMNFDEFLISLKLLSKEISKNKIELIRKNIELEKIKLKDIEEKQNKYKELEKYNNSINLSRGANKNLFDKNEFYYQCEKKKFTNEIFNLENKYTSENNKTEEEIFNNFLEYLGINNKNEYKTRFKGFLLPFQIHDKKKSLTKVKNGIGSRLESEIVEASKIFAMQKEEKMKISLSKELIKKKNQFEEKKRLYRIKNEKLIKDIMKKENRKYSDQLIDIKNELNRRKLEKIEIQKKEEYERKNIISWNRLENFNINSLEIDEIEKICNDSNNSDEEIINKISEGDKYQNKNKKMMAKNNSAIELASKNNNLQFPIISKKTNIENIIQTDKDYDNKNAIFNNYE